VMVPREELTEHRLDALEKKVDDGFAGLRSEMKAGFERMDARFEKMDKRFEKMDERFDKVNERFFALNCTLLGGAAVVIATLIGGSVF